MDIDHSRPVYVFVLDVCNTVKTPTSSVSDLPLDLLSQCRHLDDDITTSKDRPAVAVRGSTPPFGSWNVEGLRATSLSAEKYAVMVNDYLPKETRYKWLNKNSVSITGDLDPATGYHYEPDSFVDRTVSGVDGLPGDIVFVFDTWGKYSSTVHREFLDKWIPDIASDTKVTSEDKEAAIVDAKDDIKPDNDATDAEKQQTEIDKGEETHNVNSDAVKGSSDQTVDSKVVNIIVTEHYEVQKNEEGEAENEKQENEESEKESIATQQDDVTAVTANSTEASAVIQDDQIKEVASVTLDDAVQEKVEQEEEKVGTTQHDDVTTANTGTNEDQAEASDVIQNDQVKDETSMTSSNVVVQAKEGKEVAVNQVLQQEAVKSESEVSMNSTQNESIQTQCTVENVSQSLQQPTPDKAVCTANQEVLDDAQSAEEPMIQDEPENDESFMASEEIEMEIATISAKTVQKADTTGQTPDEDTENNNTILVQGKTTDVDDVFSTNESPIEKLNTSNFESSNMESEYVSEATFKRMSRISECSTPETDQVNEVLIYNKQSQITVTADRLPSSSSC